MEHDKSPCLTVDGAFVKIGDVVWSLRLGGVPRRKIVTRDLLNVWRMWRLHENHFSDESLALVKAKAAATKRLGRAKSAMRSEKKTLAKIMERLSGHEVTS